jgi:mannose-6-phosphate isomerase-like protein (cupin superfamily)
VHTEQFAEVGYLDPVRVLTPSECQQFLRAACAPDTPAPLDWHKGHAASSRDFYEIATHPAILDVVSQLLGPDVMLWGAQLVTRGPGVVHPWHSDIEPSHAPVGKTVTVWLGIDNTTADSALMVVPRSQRFGVTVQEVVNRAGERRSKATTEQVIAWAQDIDPRSTMTMPPVTDGVALFFEGHLWHHSNNVSSKTRRALLLQYATPDVSIHIPDLKHVEWPFRNLGEPRPGCLMVSGTDRAGVNRIVPAPVSTTGAAAPAQLASRIHAIDVPLKPAGERPWTPYPIFRGATAGVRSWSCHASVLAPQHSPHPPHRHAEEEVLMVLDGEVELELPDAGWARGDERLRLTRGQFVYYPPHFPHTLRTVGNERATYLMFKWLDAGRGRGSTLAFGRFDASAHGAQGEARHPWGVRQKMFAGPTANLDAFKCHVSSMPPGGSYEPHADAYDVAIVTLDGEVETLGQRVPANSVVFYPAGELHGMRNPADVAARYVVFEFHAARIPAQLRRRPSLLVRLTDPQRWKRQLTHMLSR